MTLIQTLDKINEILRTIQYVQQSKEELVNLLQKLICLVGEVLVQRDSATEELKRFSSQLWISHIMGEIDCPECSHNIPIDFFVGSKGIGGRPLTAGSKNELIELLEFPPITKEDLRKSPIPDFLPDL